MDFMEFVRNYLNLTLFNKLIERKHKISSVVFDQVFQLRTTKPSAFLKLSDIERRTKSVPVIARGAMSYAVGGRSGSVTQIEPMPIRISEFLTGSDLNNLRALYGNGEQHGQDLVQSEIDRIVLAHMERTDKTRNALCAQAITGKIDYQMSVEGGGFERYIVDYGTPLSYDVKKWNDPTTTLADIVLDLATMKQHIAGAGFSGTMKCLAGMNVFADLINKIMAQHETDRMGAVIGETTISLLGYKIILDDDSYTDRNTAGKEVTKQEVDPDKLVMFAADYTELVYAAIDDIDGGLEATPFFSKTEKVSDPSGIKVISESKPLPLLSAEAFCWAVAHDPSIPADRAMVINTQNVLVSAPEEKTWAESQLNALTKAKILEIATERGYDMAKTDADTKFDIIAEFLSLQTAAQG